MAISQRVRKIRRTLRRKRVQRGGNWSLWHIYIHTRNGATYYKQQGWDDDDIEGLKELYTNMAIVFGYFNENEELNYTVDYDNKHLIIQRQQDLNNPYANNGANVAQITPFDTGASVASSDNGASVASSDNGASVASLNPFDAFDAAHVAPLNPFDAAFEQSLQQEQPAATAAAPLVNTDPENTNNSNNSDPSVNVPSGVRPANKSNDEPTNSVEGGRKRRRRHSKTKKSKGRRKRKTRK